MPSNAEPYISLLIQVPLVGIFVWFTLKIIRVFMDFLKSRDESWQTFLDQQRKQDKDAIAHMAERFAGEIRELGKEVAELRGAGVRARDE